MPYLAAQRENNMTGTTTINISTTLYNQAADYARRHNTSVDKMMERSLMALLMQTAAGIGGEELLRGDDYQALMRRIADFQEYGQGWDDDGALPLNNEVVKNFKQVLLMSTDDELRGWTIFPAANGTLLMEYKPLEAGINIGKDDFSYYSFAEGKMEGKNHQSFSPEAVIETMRHIGYAGE